MFSDINIYMTSDIRKWMMLCEAEMMPDYPVEVDADWILQFVADMNDREDPYEGDVPEYIQQFARYRLTNLPIAAVEHDESHDPDLASYYASQATHTAPPIIYDGQAREIIDGFHRAKAAILRGDKTILAYVGYHS